MSHLGHRRIELEVYKANDFEEASLGVSNLHILKMNECTFRGRISTVFPFSKFVPFRVYLF